MGKRIARTMVFTVALALASLGLAGTAGAQDYRVGFAQPIDSLNPFVAYSSPTYFVYNGVYDLLVNFDTKTGQPDPEHSLAESWETSSDGKVWTYHLRDGVKWADGEPFTSEDVRWTFQTVLDTQNVLQGYLAGVTKIEALDPLTVRVTLDKPSAKMTSIYIPILPAHKWKDAPKKGAAIQKYEEKLPIIGTGPFMVTKLDRKQTTVLEQNPNFWGDPKPKMDRILLTVYGDAEAVLRDLKAKRLDALVSGNSRWVKELENDDSLRVWSSASPGFTEIAFNSCPPAGAGTCTGPGKGANVAVVQDPAIRQALAYAIDRQNLVDTVYAGQATPGNGLISPYYSSFYQSYADDPDYGYPHDPEKAKEILAAGGWTCEGGDVCEKDGVKAQFELMTRVDNTEETNAGKRIKAWAREVGIDIDVQPVTEDAINNKIYASGSKPDTYSPTYDAFLWGWSGDPDTPDFNFEVLRTGSSWQDSYYSNPEYDQKSLESRQTVGDDQKRLDLMHDSEKLILRDLPYIILVHDHVIYVTRRDTWHNYQPSPEGDSPAPLTTNWLQLTSLEPGPGPDADEIAAEEPAESAPDATDEAGAAESGGEVTTAAAEGAESGAASSPESAEPAATTDDAATVAAPIEDEDGGGGGMSTGVVILIVLLAMAIGGAIVLILTRGRRGGREPIEWDV
jgi:peptide/nickel transport system substrate-binding protein